MMVGCYNFSAPRPGEATLLRAGTATGRKDLAILVRGHVLQDFWNSTIAKKKLQHHGIDWHQINMYV